MKVKCVKCGKEMEADYSESYIVYCPKCNTKHYAHPEEMWDGQEAWVETRVKEYEAKDDEWIREGRYVGAKSQ